MIFTIIFYLSKLSTSVIFKTYSNAFSPECVYYIRREKTHVRKVAGSNPLEQLKAFRFFPDTLYELEIYQNMRLRLTSQPRKRSLGIEADAKLFNTR